MSTITLNSEEYEQLIRCLSAFRENCNDADIRGGILRQRSNEKNMIIEIDLTTYLNDMDLPISGLKNKLDLLKTFIGSETEIRVDDNQYSFSDQYSELKFDKPILDYMDNKFVTPEELDSIYPINNEDLLVETDVTELISDRMRIISQGFNVNNHNVVMHGDEAEIFMESQARDQTAKLIQNISVEHPFNGSTILLNVPLTVDHDNVVEFKLFFDIEGDSNLATSKYSTTIGTADMKVYIKSKIFVSNDDDDE